MLDDAQTELREAILTIHDLRAEMEKLRAERDRLRAALEAIQDIDTDWTQGGGENMWLVQCIAEEALDHAG